VKGTEEREKKFCYLLLLPSNVLPVGRLRERFRYTNNWFIYRFYLIYTIFILPYLTYIDYFLLSLNVYGSLENINWPHEKKHDSNVLSLWMLKALNSEELIEVNITYLSIIQNYKYISITIVIEIKFKLNRFEHKPFHSSTSKI